VSPKKDGLGAVIVLQDKTNHYKVLEMGKEFVANASHELRTPITIIKGFAETLQEMPNISPELFADIIEKIVRNCERMDMLVKNLLTLADIENLSESRFQACDIDRVIVNCKDNLLSLHPDIKLEVHTPQSKITLPIDPDLIEMALMNILENAVKYSPPPAHVILEVEEKEQNIEIKVSDHGIGITLPDQEHIFERFYTVNKSHARKLGGAGLGLAIVKTIIQKHQGSISVTSTLGKGTTFTIILPKRRGSMA
jgi:two-component system phosphate regulon sensor histidine kinase PhoR